jgi:hypothetical protein
MFHDEAGWKKIHSFFYEETAGVGGGDGGRPITSLDLAGYGPQIINAIEPRRTEPYARGGNIRARKPELSEGRVATYDDYVSTGRCVESHSGRQVPLYSSV